MEVADFGEYIFMTNGVEMIYWDPILLVWVTISAITTIPLMRAVCNFNGQVVGGNVVSAWYDCDETFYIWSGIGSIDFSLEQGNEAGYRRCPFGGEVYHTKKLGKAVIGYSSKGIIAISPVNDPAPTFGFTELSNIGVINKGAVGTGFYHHIYVGEDYILREVTQEGVKELGYQSQMEALGNAEDIIISYDPSNKDFYIGNSAKTYLLSPYGLTEVMQHPSAVWRSNGQSYMLPDIEDSNDPYLCSEIFDMSYAGQKSVFSIETDAMLDSGPKVALDWGDNVGVLVTENYIPINLQGTASVIGSGCFFRFRLKLDYVSDIFRISRIKVRYKMTDLRGIRGVYAPPIRGQG